MFLAVGSHGQLYFTTNFKAEPVPAHMFLVVPQAWSLGIEIIFYLLAPLILRRSVFIQIGLILASLALRFSFRYFLNLFHDPWSYRFFPFELAFFLLGSVAYRAYGSRKALYNEASTYIRWLRWPFFFALVNYDYVFGTHERGCLTLFASWFLFLPFFFLATKTSSFDKLLGELSYPLYLSHNLALYLLQPWAVNRGSPRSIFLSRQRGCFGDASSRAG